MRKLNIIAVCFLSLVFTAASPAKDKSTEPFLCSSALQSRQKHDLSQVFQTFEYDKLPLESGFLLRPRGQRGDLFENVASIQTSPQEFSFLDGEAWRVDSESFDFFNLGFKNFELYSRRVNHIVIDHFRQSPDLGLRVEYSLDRIRAAEVTQRHRWTTHDAVLRKYRAIKGYLRSRDMFLLKAPNLFSGNSDLLILARPDQTTPLKEMTQTEFTEHLLLTLQITYFGNRNFFKPTLRGLIVDSGLQPYENMDKLPFEYRLAVGKADAFRNNFYARFDPHTTCEFTRYARIAGPFSRTAHDRFLFEAFSTALRRGMKTIVASADSSTARLFHRYGFKDCEKLPIEGDDAGDEVLCTLRTNSPEFHEVFERLAALGSAVVRSTAGSP